MTEILKFEATERTNIGTGPSREFRRNDQIPAVIYGDKKDPITVVLPLNKFNIAFQKGGMKTKLVEIEIGGQKITTLPKEIQLHPVTDLPLHIDLLRIAKGSTVDVAIAIRAIGEEKAPGIKKGGAINIAHRELMLKCHPTSIPQHIDIDVSEMDIGQSIHLSDVKLPEGVEASEAPETTLLSMVGRTEESEETAESAGEDASAEAGSGDEKDK